MRNIMFIVVDQLRADCVAGALANHARLPNLQKLRREAVTFRNHFSVASPCGPARASLLTGQYAFNHGSVRNGTPLRHDTPNLATELRKAGYSPLLFGYNDVARDPRILSPNDPALKSYEEILPGFDEVLEMRMECSLPWRADLAEKGYEVPAGNAIWRPIGGDLHDPPIYRAEDSDTAFLTDQVIRDLRMRPPGWCAHVTYLRPHPPWCAPDPYNTMNEPSDTPAPAQSDNVSHPYLDAVSEDQQLASTCGTLEGIRATPETIRSVRALYFGLAMEVDHHIGRLIGFLRETGQYDDTLLIITADHGEMLGDYKQWGKSTFYDASFYVPLIVRAPDCSAQFGTEVLAPTESIDVVPTILDYIGQEVPDSMNGRSLMPFLRAVPPEDWRDTTFSEVHFGNPVGPTLRQKKMGLSSVEAQFAVLRTKTHNLVQFGGGIPPLLFDRKDRFEKCDFALDENKSPILLDLLSKMICHRMANPDGLFARTQITSEGVKCGNG